MAKKKLVTEKQVLKALKIDSFRNLSKEKIMEFVSILPNVDKEVAISIINQFPSYTEYASKMVEQLTTMCNTALKENTVSQKESIESYKLVLNSLDEILKRECITKEERDSITEKMILVADKISLKDTENKKFIKNIILCGSSIVAGALVLGAAILGVTANINNFPNLKDD